MDLYRNKYRSQTARLKDWDYGSPGYYYVTICTKDRENYFGNVVMASKDEIGSPDELCEGRPWDGMREGRPWDGMCEGRPWDGMCEGRPWDGMCEGRVGTHNYASLQPDARPSQSRDAHPSQSPDAHPSQLPDAHPAQSPDAHPAQLPDARPAQSRDATTVEAIMEYTEIGKIALRNWIDIPKHFPFVVLDEFVVMPNHIHGILYFKKPGYRPGKKNVFGPQSKNLGSVIRGYKSATRTSATKQGIAFAWQARFHDDVITSRAELDNIRRYIRKNPEKWINKKSNNQ